MPKGTPQMKPFDFYGTRYISQSACMAINGIKSYQELQSHMERERRGLPFILPKNRELKPQAEMKKRAYFERKLKAVGLWKGQS